LELVGKITKINNDLEYAFAEVKGTGKVFISPNTKYQGIKFTELKIDDLVRISVEETDRGLHAAALALKDQPTKKATKRPPEANL
jgi:hypothetical protein